jgi:hypothetical protein
MLAAPGFNFLSSCLCQIDNPWLVLDGNTKMQHL